MPEITVYPGMVFTAPHLAIDTGRLISHLFVCVYNQELDTSLESDVNVKGVIISSRPSTSRYCVSLAAAKYGFIHKESYCLTDQEYIFNKNAITVVGNLNAMDLADIIYARENIQYSESYQCHRALENISKNEIKKIEGFSKRIQERRDKRGLRLVKEFGSTPEKD